MRLLAIDPASIRTGVALFQNGILVDTFTVVVEEKNPLKRRVEMAKVLAPLIAQAGVLVSEEPQIQGRNGNGMHRLLGMIELLSSGTVNFVHPLTVKKSLGSGTLDKLEVALAAGERLQTEGEKELMAEIIEREAWDESDSIAIGLSWMEKNK